jgi:hypothetical protein
MGNKGRPQKSGYALQQITAANVERMGGPRVGKVCLLVQRLSSPFQFWDVPRRQFSIYSIIVFEVEDISGCFVILDELKGFRSGGRCKKMAIEVLIPSPAVVKCMLGCAGRSGSVRPIEPDFQAG